MVCQYYLVDASDTHELIETDLPLLLNTNEWSQLLDLLEKVLLVIDPLLVILLLSFLRESVLLLLQLDFLLLLLLALLLQLLDTRDDLTQLITDLIL